MKISLDLQLSEQLDQHDFHPQLSQMRYWLETALPMAYRQLKQPVPEHIELTIRLVDAEEIKSLNAYYRNKNNTTNILSFPADIPEYVDSDLIGDLIIYSRLIEQEAEAQGKPVLSHWAHIIIHGALHLLGFDHIEEQQAVRMESLETVILEHLGFDQPYCD